MTQEIKIKEGSVDEVLALGEFVPEFTPAYSRAELELRYQKLDHLVLCAFIDKAPIGYLIAYNRDNDGSLYCWLAAVHISFRQRGVLKKLMEYLEYWAKERNYQKITIKTYYIIST